MLHVRNAIHACAAKAPRLQVGCEGVAGTAVVLPVERQQLRLRLYLLPLIRL